MKNEMYLREQLAMIAHEANRALQVAAGEQISPPWAKAPAWQKESARDGVLNVIENPDVSPGDSHANWLKHKQADGWKYGPVKDEQKKEHPCMVPFHQLPPVQRLKDDLFTAIVRYIWITLKSANAAPAKPGDTPHDSTD